MAKGYCMKCQMKRDMVAAHKITKNGHHMMKGKCKFCGTKMNKFVK